MNYCSFLGGFFEIFNGNMNKTIVEPFSSTQSKRRMPTRPVCTEFNVQAHNHCVHCTSTVTIDNFNDNLSLQFKRK